jgi:hypothetical protein
MVRELMNVNGSIPEYNPFATVNWGGPLYVFQSDSKHVI